MELPSGPTASTARAQLTPLSWNEFFDEKQELKIAEDKFNVYLKGSEGPVFFLLHGAGFSGLTWACFAKELSAKVSCQIVAPDLRGHGLTSTADDSDLSLERQINDIANIYKELFAKCEKPPKLIVVGHSMGGALAVNAIHAGLIPNVVTLAVIDVVEGTAKAALPFMKQFLRSRPQHFASPEQAVRWCVESGNTKHIDSARVSMPAQICRVDDKYHWRINLAKTEPFWQNWFSDLSKKFLECTPNKILILANVDRLDKELMIGQMRGTFQYEVVSDVGHCVQEDAPEKVADIFAKMINRYKFIFNK